MVSLGDRVISHVHSCTCCSFLQKNGVTKRLIADLPTPTEDPVLPEEPCPQADPMVNDMNAGTLCMYTPTYTPYIHVGGLANPQYARSQL